MVRRVFAGCAPVACTLACALLASGLAAHPAGAIPPRFADPGSPPAVAGPARVQASSSYDALWTGYPLPSVNGTTYAMVPFAGGVAMAGNIPYWGTTYSDRVALWDGIAWQPLGSGVPATVRALAVYDGKLIAASQNFGVIYAWDGVAWTTIGDADGPVLSLLVDGTDLYAGGEFFNIDGVPATLLARWDGASWHQAGANLNRPRQSGGGIYPTLAVRALARMGTDLYAGGMLPGYEGIARWDGVAWSTAGAGLQNGTLAGSVDALATDGSTLYASGTFNSSGGSALTRIAAWDGALWSGLPGATAASSALALFGGQLVGTVPDAGTPRPQFWNGSSWSPYNHADVSPVAYAADGTTLYAAGYQSGVISNTPVTIDPFYGFDGASWTPLHQAWSPDMKGISGVSYAAQEWGGSLYVAGLISWVGAGGNFLRVAGVAKWDGSDWVSIPGGGQQFDLSVWQDSLVASVNGTVKVWNGSAWRNLPLTGSFDSYGNGLAVYQGDLYVLGPQTAANGSVQLNGVGRWNGSAWEALGSGIDDPQGFPFAGVQWGSYFAIGGQFSEAGGGPARNLAYWDGAAYHEIGGGVNDWVNSLLADGSDLIVGGEFTEAGGESLTAVARWDGSQWHAMGSRARLIYRLRTHGGRIYAAGAFLDDFGQVVAGAARWNGSEWTLLGSGLDPYASAYALGFLGDDLYVVGAFGSANGHPARGFAKLANVSTLDVTPGVPAPRLALAPSPNPSRGSVRFAVTLPAAGRARLVIHDVSGREVARLLDGTREAGTFSLAWEGHAAPGLYFATLDAAGARTTTRVVRLR